MSRLMLSRLLSSVCSVGKEVLQRLTDPRKVVSLLCAGQHHTLLFSRKSAVLECMIPKLVLGNLRRGIDSLPGHALQPRSLSDTIAIGSKPLRWNTVFS